MARLAGGFMKKALLTITLIVGMVFASGTAGAVYMEISELAGPSEFGVFITNDGTDALDVFEFQFHLDFDGTELSLVSTSGTSLFPATWTFYNQSDSNLWWYAWENPPETTAGENAYRLLSGESWMVAGLEFSLDNPIIDGQSDLWFDTSFANEPQVNFNQVEFFNSSDIPPSAVPLPGAFWLLGSGIIGLIGYRKRISQA
jgi:hypothetical protein